MLSPLFHDVSEYHRRGRAGAGALLARALPDPDRFASLRWGRGDLRRRMRELLERAERVLVAGEAERAALERRVGALDDSRLGRAPVVVPPRPSEDALPGSGPLFGGRPFAVFVGRLEPLKRPLAVIEAARRVGAPLLLLGPIPRRHPAYALRLRRAIAGGDVVALGPRPRREVLAWLGQAAVLVSASWAEVAGRGILEAGQAGCAVVASRTGCLPETLGDAVRWVAPGDDDALARGLADAMGAPRPGRAGVLARRVSEHHGDDALCDALLDAYGAAGVPGPGAGGRPGTGAGGRRA